MQVKDWRKELGITQRELAEASELDLRWIQKIESGEISMANITMKKCIQLIKGICDLSENKGIDDDFIKTRNAYVWLNDLIGESR